MLSYIGKHRDETSPSGFQFEDYGQRYLYKNPKKLKDSGFSVDRDYLWTMRNRSKGLLWIRRDIMNRNKNHRSFVQGEYFWRRIENMVGRRKKNVRRLSEEFTGKGGFSRQ